MVCADLVAGSLQEILKWINMEEGAFDWMPYMTFISEKEGMRFEILYSHLLLRYRNFLLIVKVKRYSVITKKKN